MTVPLDWKRHSPCDPGNLDMPLTWYDKKLEWKKDYHSTPVFIGQTKTPAKADVYLFGNKYHLSNATSDGKELYDAFFVEYLILELNEKTKISHILKQPGSVTFSSTITKDDHINASDLSVTEIQSLTINHTPNWKTEDAQWPTHNNVPMRFVKQFLLIDNAVTREHLTWDESVFLFWEQEQNKSIFKIYDQPTNYQSAEDHYALE